MAGRNNVETIMSYACLTAPLVSNPVSDLEKVVNKLKMKYRYIVEYNMEESDKIHATVKKALVKSFQQKIQEAASYELEQVMVGLNKGPLKLTNNKYKINMMQNSKWTKITNGANIPLNSFFASFASILESSMEEKIIGSVRILKL